MVHEDGALREEPRVVRRADEEHVLLAVLLQLDLIVLPIEVGRAQHGPAAEDDASAAEQLERADRDRRHVGG
eukprot:2229839-Pleurochrysis_carterae.AAC.1